MYIPLDRESGLTLSRQIAHYLEGLIRHEHLARGARLPATRTLARSLGVSKGTVEHAYDELAQLELVRVRPGKEVRVASEIPEATELPLPFRSPKTPDPWPSKPWTKAKVPEAILDLAAEGPKTWNIPVQVLRKWHKELLASRTPAFSEPPPLGEAALRAAAARHFARLGILRSADEVAIFRDRGAAIRALLWVFGEPSKIVVTDEWLDADVVRALESSNATLRKARGGRGTPSLILSNSGSSGVPSVSEEDTVATSDPARLARDLGIPLVEDVSRFEHGPPPYSSPPTAALDEAARTLAVCDLHDEVGGPMRAAALAAPTKLLEKLRPSLDGRMGPDRLSQRAIALALDAPGRTRVRRNLSERRELLGPAIKRSIRRRLAIVERFEFSAGFDRVRLDLPEGIAGSPLRDLALEHGVRILAARDFGAPTSRDDFAVLDLTSHEEGELLEGIRRLGIALDEFE